MATFTPRAGYVPTSVIFSLEHGLTMNTARFCCSGSHFLTGQRVSQNAVNPRHTCLPSPCSRSRYQKFNRGSRASIQEASHSEPAVAVAAEGHENGACGAGAGAGGGRKVVVVGAGWAGLGAAYHLTKQVMGNRLTSRTLLMTTEADNRISCHMHLGNSNDRECVKNVPRAFVSSYNGNTLTTPTMVSDIQIPR